MAVDTLRCRVCESEFPAIPTDQQENFPAASP